MPPKRYKSVPASPAPLFAALGDERRLRLLARLCTDGPASITRLAAGGDISRQAITKHLHVLARAGLVRGTQQGREQLYELEPQRLQDASQYLEVVSRQWEQALGRLKDLVEGVEGT